MAKRTRSSGPIEPEPTTIAPAAKKQRTSTPRYHCFACEADKPDKSFPDTNPSPDCEGHLINICKQCLKDWTSAQIEFGGFATGGEDDEMFDGKAFGVPCPECPAIMRSVNIRLVVTKKLHANFEAAKRAHIADITPGWRWCMASDCNAGQVHTTKEPPPPKEEQPEKVTPKKPKTRGKKGVKAKPEVEVEVESKVESEPDICTCNECGAQACVTCDRPMHDEETCEEYQLRIKDRTAEEDASLIAIKKFAKKCPQCSRNIQKDGGCPSMWCKFALFTLSLLTNIC